MTTSSSYGNNETVVMPTRNYLRCGAKRMSKIDSHDTASGFINQCIVQMPVADSEDVMSYAHVRVRLYESVP